MQNVGKINNWKMPLIQMKNIITDTVSNFISSYSKMESLELVVPKTIYLRTLLICEHIQDKTEQAFDIITLLTILYQEFIDNYIEEYNPNVIRQEINRSYRHDEKLLIHSNDRIYAYDKSTCRRIVFSFYLDKKSVEKGELLLDELEEIYGEAPTIEKMIATLWINFIEDYKTGENKKPLQKIITLYEKYYSDQQLS